MRTLPPIAVILAGGASSRMGRDKAEVPIGGVASLDRVLAAARAVLGEVAILGGARAGAHPDLIAGGGPVQAVVSAMRAWPGRDLVVLPCDVPFVTPALVEALAAPIDPPREARVLRQGGWPQALCAHYTARARPRFEAALARDERAIRKVVAELDVAWLDEGDLDPASRAGAQDFDTPGDLAALLRASPGSAFDGGGGGGVGGIGGGDGADVDVEPVG